MDKKERLAPYLARIKVLNDECEALWFEYRRKLAIPGYIKSVEEQVRIDKHYEKLMCDVDHKVEAIKDEIEAAGLWEEYCDYEYGREEDYEE